MYKGTSNRRQMLALAEAGGSRWKPVEYLRLSDTQEIENKFYFEVNTYNETVKIPSHLELSK